MTASVIDPTDTTEPAVAPVVDAGVGAAAEFNADGVVYKKTAVGEKDVQAAKLAAIAETGKFKATGRVNSDHQWRSGWCGSWTRCLDGRPDPVTQVPKHRCFGRAENGANVKPRFVYCACACHTTNANAVQFDHSGDTA